jgi:hypothetical protein
MRKKMKRMMGERFVVRMERRRTWPTQRSHEAEGNIEGAVRSKKVDRTACATLPY